MKMVEATVLALMKGILLFTLFLTVIGTPVFSQDLIDAVKKGDLRRVKELLNEDPECVHEQDRVHYTPLHWAAMLRNRDIAEFLISCGADINDRSNNQHLTPLQSALMFRYGDDPAVLDFFIDQSASVECKGEEGIFNLRIASAAGYERLIRLLLSGGVDENGRSKYGLTALHIAAWSGQTGIVEYLLENGSDIDSESLDGRRPITMARESKKEDIVDLLTSRGADQSPQRFPRLRGKYLGMRRPGLRPEIFALGIVSTENREHSGLVFSPDLKELYFTIQFERSEGGYGQHMFVMREENGHWTKPQNPFQTTYGNNCGSISSDGKRMYFHSHRPRTENGERIRDTDIWLMERTGYEWDEPVRLSAPINSDFFDVGPKITDSGALYFSSNRDNGNSDIYRAGYQDGRFLAPEKIKGAVNTESYETISYVAPDESFLIYYYHYPGDFFQPGLMISFQNADGSWGKPVDMKGTLGLKANDLLHAGLSPDGKYLFILDDMDIYWVDAKILGTFRPK